MKFLKKLLVGFLALILIASIILWFFAKSLNPELIKNYVSSQLSTLTAKKSQVNGVISWQLFPRPGIRITQIQIGDENEQNNYFAKVDNLLFNLKITPLLRGKLVFNELNMDGFKININQDISSPTKTSKTIANKNADNSNKIADQFAIERILLSHGQLIISQNQRKITLSGLQIGAEGFNLQQEAFPLQFKTNLDISADNQKSLKAHVNFKGSTSLSSALFFNPVVALENTSMEGQLSLQNIKIKELKINTLRANVKTKPGVFLLNPLTLNLYNGESVGDLSYEFASNKLLVNQTATNLDGGKFIYDLVNKNLFKGSIDFSIHAQSNLQNPHWQDSTTGHGNLTIKDGMIESVNLDKVIDGTSEKISSLLKGTKEEIQKLLQLGQFDDPSFFKGSTAFKLLTFQYRLQDGKLISDSLTLQTEKLQLKGDGSLDLKTDNALDSHLLARVSLSNNEIDQIQQLLGGSFPIVVKGTLTQPIVLPDLQIINPILTKTWLKNTLLQPAKKVQEQLKTLLIR